MPRKVCPYWVFVTATRKLAEENGLDFSEAQCGQRWKEMSSEQRSPYITIAKERTASKFTPSPSSGAATLNSHSKSESPVAAEDAENAILTTVQSYLTSSLEEAMEKPVLMAACNLLLEWDDKDVDLCIPLEIAFVTYSAFEGITSMYQKFTDPGHIPTGYIYSSRTFSAETHRIPAVDFGHAVGRHSRSTVMQILLDQIIAYMKSCYKKDDKILLLTRKDMVPQLRASLAYYAKESGHEAMCKLLHDKIVVADVAYLIGHLSNLAGEPIRLEECKKMMASVMFDYKNRCDYHHHIDNNFCALSLCCRWCYIVSDYMLSNQRFNLLPIPGHHLPQDNESAFVHHGDYAGVEFWSEDDSAVRDLERPASLQQRFTRSMSLAEEQADDAPDRTTAVPRSRPTGRSSTPTGFSLRPGAAFGRGQPINKFGNQ